MAATEIASAYVALYVRMPGVEKEIKSQLEDTGVLDTVEQTGNKFGTRLLDGISSIGKVGAIAVGGAIAAGLGTALVKGFQRLDALDQATAKLTGLGHSAETVEQIMDNALASVKGTAFGMDAAATTAAGAVAAGIKPGEDLERTLKAVADAATIAGVDMDSMGAIFNKVAASNKVQMDTINQLHDAGVPALALLADEMGVTAEEAAKMASAGEINFETFRAAMEAGMGGAALESGNTFSGAMDNVMASVARIGENVLKGLFPDMKDGLQGLQDALAPLEDLATDVGKALGEFVGWVKENINWLGPLAMGIGIAVGAIVLWTAVQWLLNAALTANPIGLIVVAIGLLIGAIILLVQNWDEVVAWISDVWDGFVSWLVDIMEGVAAWWTDIWDGITSFFTDIWDGIVAWFMSIPMFAWLIDTILLVANNWDAIWEGVGQTFENIWNGIADFFKGIANGILGAVQGFVNGFVDIINGITGGINDVSGVIGIEAIPRIGHVTLPRLAAGAYITARSGGILANVGEGRYDEIVQPTDGPKFDDFVGRLADQLGGRGSDAPIRLDRESIELLGEVIGQKLKGYSRTDQRGWAV